MAAAAASHRTCDCLADPFSGTDISDEIDLDAIELSPERREMIKDMLNDEVAPRGLPEPQRASGTDLVPFHSSAKRSR